MMMIPFLRKNITSLLFKPNSTNLCHSPFSLSLSFKYLSSSTESEPATNHTLCNILVHSHAFDPAFASRVASKLTNMKKPENAGLILSFLKESGFSDFRLEKIVKYRPQLLSASLEDTIKPKIILFQEMGFSSDDISKMLSSSPGILQLSLNNNIIPSMALLKRLLVSNDEVARIIRLAPRILTSNLEKTMLRNVELFMSCGVPMERIRIVLLSCPRGFIRNPEAVRKSTEKAKEMGVDVSSKTFIYAVSTIAKMGNEACLLKLEAYRSLGFSDSNILIMFRKAPQILATSKEKVKKIKELLLNTGKYTVSSIVQCPKSLLNSIEKRYLPRLHILGILERRNLIKDWPCLSTVSKKSDDEFFKKIIGPYSDKISDVLSIDKTFSIYLKVPK